MKRKLNEIEIDTKNRRIFIDGNEVNGISNINFNWKGGEAAEVHIIVDAKVKLTGEVEITQTQREFKEEELYKIDKNKLLGLGDD